MSKKIEKAVEVSQVEALESQVIEAVETEVVDPNFDELYVPLVKKINMPKTVKTGVGARCMELIKTGEYTSKEIVEIVNQENPLRKTTYACVAWYKNDMKKKGIVIG